MLKLPAIIFDMDGVITDTEPLHAQAEYQVCEEYGIKADKSAWGSFQGMTTIGIFQAIIEKFAPDWDDLNASEMTNRKIEIYLELAQKGLPIVPGSVDFIKKWSKEYFEKVALATSSTQPIQKASFDAYDLWPYFDSIVTGNDIKKGKPNPDPYLLAAERLGVDPKDCLVLEDSDNGIRAAVAAGCTAIGITTTFTPEQLVSFGAKTSINNYEELEQGLRSGELIK